MRVPASNGGIATNSLAIVSPIAATFRPARGLSCRRSGSCHSFVDSSSHIVTSHDDVLGVTFATMPSPSPIFLAIVGLAYVGWSTDFRTIAVAMSLDERHLTTMTAGIPIAPATYIGHTTRLSRSQSYEACPF